MLTINQGWNSVESSRATVYIVRSLAEEKGKCKISLHLTSKEIPDKGETAPPVTQEWDIHI